MKAFNNYGISHLLATLIATTAVAIVPFLALFAIGLTSESLAGATYLAVLCYVIMAVIGIPTELRLRAKNPNPTLRQAYVIYLKTGLAAAALIAFFYFAIYGMKDVVLPIYLSGIQFAIYLPIMVFARGIFVPIERKLRVVFPRKPNPAENEVTDVLQ
jgi:hypothetical protein